MSKSYARVRIPKMYWGEKAEVGKIESDVVQKYVTELPQMVGEGLGLLLWGKHGSGKTAAACSILKELTKTRKLGLFVRFDWLATMYVENTRFDEYQSYVDRMHEVDLLVIDELIYDKSRIYTLGRVEQVLRYRTSEVKPTILTTNIPLSSLKSQATGLYEACREATYPVKMDGSDFRAERVREMTKRLGVK